MSDYDRPKFGVSQTLALALAALNLDIVHRSTLRALLPAGRTWQRRPRMADRTPEFLGTVRRTNGLDKGSHNLIQNGAMAPRANGASRNQMSEKFKDALYKLEKLGWIVRGEEFILVRSRRDLLDWAIAAEPRDSIEIPLQLAIDQINCDLHNAAAMSPKAIEQRRQELIAIKRLMDEGFGENWSGRGSIRFVPRSKVI